VEGVHIRLGGVVVPHQPGQGPGETRTRASETYQ
jgi:hypothetical protein